MPPLTSNTSTVPIALSAALSTEQTATRKRVIHVSTSSMFSAPPKASIIRTLSYFIESFVSTTGFASSDNSSSKRPVVATLN